MGATMQQKPASVTEARPERRRLLRTLFFCYVLALVWLLFARRAEIALGAWDHYFEAERISLVPFATIRRYLRAIRNGVVVEIALINLFGNLVLFMPMGALLPLLFPSLRRAWRFLLLQTGLLCSVEAMQLILRCGSCDADDVILNLLGAALAYAVCRLILWRREWSRKAAG